MPKFKPMTVRFVPLSDVFDGKLNALHAFEESGKHSYGDNDLTLVMRDTMINNMKDHKGSEIDSVIQILNTLDPTTYIDLES